MSIDKESSGLPGINVHHIGTKVNLWIIAGVVFFLGLALVVGWRVAIRQDRGEFTAPRSEAVRP